MKTSILINNGKTEIILTPENDFERDVIEKVIDKEYEVTKTNVEADYLYSSYSKHKITINIEQK